MLFLGVQGTEPEVEWLRFERSWCSCRCVLKTRTKRREDSYAISLPLDTNQNNCTDSNSLLILTHPC